MNIFEEIHLWFHDRFIYEPGSHELLYIVLKLVIGFAILLLISRLLGKKELRQYTPFDFVFVILLSGLLEETVYHHETPYFEFIIAIVTWVVLSMIVEKLVQRYEKLRPVIKGQPQLLINRGAVNINVLKQNNLEMEQVRHALRSKGVFSIEEVDYAVLETNGEINVKRKPAYQPIQKDDIKVVKKAKHSHFPIMLIEEGRFIENNGHNVSEKWVMSRLKQDGVELDKVFYAELIGDQLYYKFYRSKGGGDNGKSDGKTN